MEASLLKRSPEFNNKIARAPTPHARRKISKASTFFYAHRFRSSGRSFDRRLEAPSAQSAEEGS